MQPKNITKSDYYKQKKIPIISICRKLQSQPPVMTHLIQTLPRLATEIQKIKSEQVDSNRTNLELANALKIIHELEFELETITSRYNESEEELLFHQNQSKQLSRHIQRNEEVIISLQSTIQKNQFSTKAKFEYEKDYYNSILIQYEKRIEDMNEAYDQLKRDREKELREAKIFHQDNINKAENRAREFENETQEDVKNLQKELEKAIDLNSSFRKKITDLQTFNQEHIRNLQKTNTELSQTNLRLKTQYEHKLMAVQTSFDLSENKIKELLNTLKLYQNRLEKEQNSWQEEKKSLVEQNIQNEKIWKNSYNEVNKQKDRTLQELNNKIILLGDREREESSLLQKIRSLQRLISELSQQKTKTLEDNQRTKKQITQTLLLDHHLKINEIKLQNQRFVSQQMKRVLEIERRTLQERYTIEVTKYIEQIKQLQNQKLDDCHAVRLSEDFSRKLQVKIDQMNVEIEYLNKHNQEYCESFRNQTKTMDEQFQYKLNNEQKRYLSQIEKVKSEREIEQYKIKESYEVTIRQLSSTIQLKSNQMRQLQNKIKQIEDNLTNERTNFGFRVQELEFSIGKYKIDYETLLKANKNYQQRTLQLQSHCRSYQKTIQQEVNVRNRITQELNTQNQNAKRLKDELIERQNENVHIIKKLESEIFEHKRKNSNFSIEVQRLTNTVFDYGFKFQNVKKQLKALEQEKTGLQKKLIEKDTSSQEKWKIIETDFNEMSKRITSESEIRQQELRNIIRQRDEIIEKQKWAIKDLQDAVDRQRSTNQNLNHTWQAKCRQFEEANKKLIKSSFTMQDLEKQNIGKEVALKNLVKDIERYRSEIEQKNKQITNFNTEYMKLESLVNQMNFEKEGLKNQIGMLENQNKNLENDFMSYRERVQNQLSDLRKSQTNKLNDLQKWERDSKFGKKRLEETQQVIQKMAEQKRRSEQKIILLQRQLEETSNSLKQQRKESIHKISELEERKLELESKLRETLEKLKRQSNQQQRIIEKNQRQLEKFEQKLSDYETKLLQKIDELERTQKNLENEKMTSSMSKIAIETSKEVRENLEKKIKNIQRENEYLKKQKLTFEKNLKEVYQENDRKLKQNEQVLTRHYESFLSQKAEQIVNLENKFSQSSQRQKFLFNQRQTQFNEQKEEFIKEISIKTEEITFLKIQYDHLFQELNKKERELQIYRKKWATIFEDVQSANEMIAKVVEREEEQRHLNLRIAREEARSQKMLRTERSEKTSKTDLMSHFKKNSPSTYQKSPRQMMSFQKERSGKQLFHDFDMSHELEKQMLRVDVMKNEAFIISRPNLHKPKEQENERNRLKQNISCFSNTYESRSSK